MTNCTKCGSELKLLFMSRYCPNDCDRTTNEAKEAEEGYGYGLVGSEPEDPMSRVGETIGDYYAYDSIQDLAGSITFKGEKWDKYYVFRLKVGSLRRRLKVHGGRCADYNNVVAENFIGRLGDLR
jgi:hypothetical protein